MIEGNFFRIHIEDLSYLTKLPKGLFAAVGNLVDSKTMTASEIDEYWKQRARLEDSLPIPPFYNDGNSKKAITWFKNNERTLKINAELKFYFNILGKYGKILFITTSKDIPGKIIYEDEFQIGIIGSKHSGKGFQTKKFHHPYVIDYDGNQILIREANKDDVDIFYKWWNDGTIMSHAGFPQGLGISKTAIEGIINRNSHKEKRFLILVSGRPIGEMHYRFTQEKTAVIGIKICNSDFRKKGFGTTAIGQLLEIVFRDLDCERVQLDTASENIAAQEFYSKIGFRQKELKTNNWTDQNGNLPSSVEYELTYEEWKEHYEDGHITIIST